MRKIIKMAVLQHVPFEGPAAIADWAVARESDIAVRHFYRGDPLPELAEFDMLTVMGGPMSANDEAVLPWLAPETALVGDAIASEKVVLGVCLGAQIIAKALGAKGHKERSAGFRFARTPRMPCSMGFRLSSWPFTGTAKHSISRQRPSGLHRRR